MKKNDVCVSLCSDNTSTVCSPPECMMKKDKWGRNGRQSFEGQTILKAVNISTAVGDQLTDQNCVKKLLRKHRCDIERVADVVQKHR